MVQQDLNRTATNKEEATKTVLSKLNQFLKIHKTCSLPILLFLLLTNEINDCN